MTLHGARHEAARISLRFGRTILFRERSKLESYQAIAESGALDPRLGLPLAVYRDGGLAPDIHQTELF